MDGMQRARAGGVKGCDDTRWNDYGGRNAPDRRGGIPAPQVVSPNEDCYGTGPATVLGYSGARITMSPVLMVPLVAL